MRIRLLMAALFLAALTTHAQKDLSGSRQSSLYTYVYRVQPKQALSLFRNDMYDWKAMATNPVDSFIGDNPHLPTGDYVFVRAAGSDLVATLQTVPYAG